MQSLINIGLIILGIMIIMLPITWLLSTYVSALYHALRGNPTEKESSKGKVVKDDNGIDIIREPVLLFKPEENRAYPVVRGGSFQLFIMEFTNRLFAIKVKRWFDENTDKEKRKKMATKIAELNPLFFPKREHSEESLAEIISLFTGDDLNPWNIYTVPDELYPFRFNGFFDELLHSIAGFRMIGWFPWSGKVPRRKFFWTGVVNEGANTVGESDDFVSRKAYTNFFIIAKTLYGLKIKKAEDGDRIPLDIELQIEIEGINPYTSIFGFNNWLASLEGFVYAVVTEVVRNNSYTSIINSATGGTSKPLEDFFISQIEKAILNLNLKIPGSNPEVNCPMKLGVLITGVQVKEIDPSDTSMTKRIREAMITPYLAEQNAKLIRIEAEAKMDAMVAEALGTEALYAALGDAAVAALAYRSLPKNLQVLGGDAMVQLNPRNKGEENE